MSNENHAKIIKLFDDGKLAVEFGDDKAAYVIGASGKRIYGSPLSGYPRVSIYDNEKLRSNKTKKGSREESVHLIVYLWANKEGFDSNTHQIHHINGIKHDNSIENLSLETKQNHGRIGQTRKKNAKKSLSEVPIEQQELIKNIFLIAPRPDFDCIAKLFDLQPSLVQEIYMSIRKPS